MTATSGVLRAAALASLLCVAGPVSAWAQTPVRDGFWIGFGLGAGSATATCDDDCDDDERETAPAGYVKAGWTLSERVLLGVDASLWSKSEDVEGVELAFSMYHVLGTLTLYPSASSGFFVKGGAGLAFVDTDFSEGRTTTTTELGNGLGLVAGAGYDIRLGRRVALTPAVDVYYGSIGDLKVSGETLATGWKQNVVAVTIGLTFP